MPTNPVTYRVSPEVDAELKRLAKIHGGTDKALRVLFGWADPAVAAESAKEILDEARRSVVAALTTCPECGRRKGHSIGCATHNLAAAERQQFGREFKGPIPRLKDKKR